MRITDLLDKKSVTLDLVASTKMEAIDKMVDLVENSGNLNNKEEYKKAIIAREEMSTTGIGEGVAIPHAKTKAVNKACLAAGVSKDGIDYTSINVENNSTHYLYSRTYDRIYISLNYNPAHGNDKYCNLTISYNISSPSVSRTFRVKFAENNTMVCEIDDDIELLNVATIIKMLNIIVEDYISE